MSFFSAIFPPIAASGDIFPIPIIAVILMSDVPYFKSRGYFTALKLHVSVKKMKHMFLIKHMFH